jgi:hypothetical protein
VSSNNQIDLDKIPNRGSLCARDGAGPLTGDAPTLDLSFVALYLAVYPGI